METEMQKNMTDGLAKKPFREIWGPFWNCQGQGCWDCSLLSRQSNSLMQQKAAQLAHLTDCNRYLFRAAVTAWERSELEQFSATDQPEENAVLSLAGSTVAQVAFWQYLCWQETQGRSVKQNSWCWSHGFWTGSSLVPEAESPLSCTPSVSFTHSKKPTSHVLRLFHGANEGGAHKPSVSSWLFESRLDIFSPNDCGKLITAMSC